jgi:osmotically-inducible protein OsmY
VSDHGDGYLLERIRTALAEDPRVGELGVEVTVEPGLVVVAGEVATAERRAAVEEVVREVAPDHRLDDRMTTLTLGGPGEAETVA